MIAWIFRHWHMLTRSTLLVYASILMYLTHAPIPKAAARVTSQWDKSLHCIAYFILTMLCILAFLNLKTGKHPKRRLLAWLLVFAALDEILQGPVGRHPDVVDWMYDAIGIVLALLTAHLTGLWLKANQSLFTQYGLPQFNEVSQ